MQKIIKWIIKYNQLTIVEFPQQYVWDLLQQLSYSRKVFNRRLEKWQFEYTPCAMIRVGGEFIAPNPWNPPTSPITAIQTLHGYTDRLLRWAGEHGIQVQVQNQTPGSSVYEPHWEVFGTGLEFRHRQREVLRCMAMAPGGYIECPPAYGKTHIMSAAAELFPSARILMTAYNKSVYQAIARRVRERVDPRTVYLHGENKPKSLIPHCRIVVCGLTSLEAVLAQGIDYDFCFIDEAHEATTEKRWDQLQKLVTPRIFCFSATPKRADGSEFCLEGLSGPIRVRMSYQEAVQYGIVTPVHVFWVPVRLSYNPCVRATLRNFKSVGLWHNDDRNKLIAAAAKCYPEDVQVLIMCETIQHVDKLHALLPEFTVLTGETACREAYERRFFNGELKKVIATMIWRQGVDFPALSVLIRADGQNSRIADLQIPGRTSRLHTDKPSADVVDFFDDFDPHLTRVSRERQKAYQKYGWRQQMLSVPQLLEGRFVSALDESDKKTIQASYAPLPTSTTHKAYQRL